MLLWRKAGGAGIIHFKGLYPVAYVYCTGGNISALIEGIAGEIVEHIQAVSSITKDVSTHSSAACASTETNQRTVRDVQALVDKMTATADRLQNIRE